MTKNQSFSQFMFLVDYHCFITISNSFRYAFSIAFFSRKIPLVSVKFYLAKPNGLQFRTIQQLDLSTDYRNRTIIVLFFMIFIFLHSSSDYLLIKFSLSLLFDCYFLLEPFVFQIIQNKSWVSFSRATSMYIFSFNVLGFRARSLILQCIDGKISRMMRL